MHGDWETRRLFVGFGLKKTEKEIVFELMNYEPIERASFIFGIYPIKEGFKNSIDVKKYLIAKSKINYDEILFFLNLNKYQGYNCKILKMDSDKIFEFNLYQTLYNKYKKKNIEFVHVIYECF